MEHSRPERTVDLERTRASRTRHLNAVRALRSAPSEMTAQRMAALVAEIGASIDTDAELDVALRSIVDIAYSAIGGADSCSASIVINNRMFTAVHTDARTLEVDAQQYAAGEGPCLHAARTGEVVRVDTSENSARWPKFAAAARREGIHSFLAAPLQTAEQRFGALNLYGEAVDAFTDDDVAIVSALTEALARAAGDYQRFDTVRDANEGLRVALEQRAPIEQAKGILMAIHRVGPEEAFDILAAQSQKDNRKLRDIAIDFVRETTTPSN